MLSITKKIEFDMGHCLTNKNSKCFSPHGHRYVLFVSVTNETLNENGMIIDFGDLKSIVKGWIDKNLDHGFMISSDDVRVIQYESTEFAYSFYDMVLNVVRTKLGEKYIIVNFEPTAENIVKFLYHILTYLLDYEITKLTIYETPNSSATITRKDV